jgi:hypothetical protein
MAPAADSEIASLARLHRYYAPRPSPLNLLTPNCTDLDLLAQQPELAPIFLFHRDGYVREAALTLSCAPPSSAFFLAVVVWRLNDWVQAVRIAARHYAERTLPMTSPNVVADAAPFLLDRWRHWGRWDETNMAVVDSALQRSDVAPFLAERFLHGTTGPLGTMLQYALRGPSLDDELPRLAASAVQPSVRAVALRTLIKEQASWPAGLRKEWIDKVYGLSRRIRVFASRNIKRAMPLNPLIAMGLRDRSAMVRRVAADSLIEHRDTFPDVQSAISLLARDKSPALRQRADFLARQGE